MCSIPVWTETWGLIEVVGEKINEPVGEENVNW